MKDPNSTGVKYQIRNPLGQHCYLVEKRREVATTWSTKKVGTLQKVEFKKYSYFVTIATTYILICRLKRVHSLRVVLLNFLTPPPLPPRIQIITRGYRAQMY